jgi:hypothetical protein
MAKIATKYWSFLHAFLLSSEILLVDMAILFKMAFIIEYQILVQPTPSNSPI